MPPEQPKKPIKQRSGEIGWVLGTGMLLLTLLAMTTVFFGVPALMGTLYVTARPSREISLAWRILFVFGVMSTSFAVSIFKHRYQFALGALEVVVGAGISWTTVSAQLTTNVAGNYALLVGSIYFMTKGFENMYKGFKEEWIEGINFG
jgi:hypothetical protein